MELEKLYCIDIGTSTIRSLATKIDADYNLDFCAYQECDSKGIKKGAKSEPEREPKVSRKRSQRIDPKDSKK